jgi:methionine sulfoxide reductase heme-binding subunit
VHLIASSATWYAARAGGVVAYMLVTAAVVAGVGLAGKVRMPGLPRFAVEDIHRFLGLLAGTFVAVHVMGIVLDSTVAFSPRQVLVPFTASYRPLWTGLGVVAMELLVALAITNRLRTKLPYRLWRRLHYASFAVWLAATAHGVMSGTDRDQVWLRTIYVLAVASVVGSLAVRVRRSAPRPDTAAAGSSRAGAVSRAGTRVHSKAERPSAASERSLARQVSRDRVTSEGPRR